MKIIIEKKSTLSLRESRIKAFFKALTGKGSKSTRGARAGSQAALRYKDKILAAYTKEVNLLKLLQKLKDHTYMRNVEEGKKIIAQINKLLKNSNQPDHQGILTTINAGFGYAVKGADPKALKYLDRVIDNTKEGMIGLQRATGRRLMAQDAANRQAGLDASLTFQQSLKEMIMEEIDNVLSEKCWPGYEKKGMKTMFGKRYPNCVKKTKKKSKRSKKKNEEIEEEVEESLKDWFEKSKSTDGKPGWVQVVSGKPCARQPGQKTTPKCVSSAKRRSMTKKQRKAAQARKRRKDPNQPKKSGAAKPTYVATDSPRKKKRKKRKKRKSA